MTVTENEQRRPSPSVQVILDYFAIADGKKEGDLLALFTDDAEVFFPKFGIGHGKNALGEMGGGFMQLVQSIEHNVDDFRIVESGDTVVVEGTSQGITSDGTRWSPSETGAGGRFCSVYDLRDGQIRRMAVYLDPDYGNATASQYPWSQRGTS